MHFSFMRHKNVFKCFSKSSVDALCLFLFFFVYARFFHLDAFEMRMNTKAGPIFVYLSSSIIYYMRSIMSFSKCGCELKLHFNLKQMRDGDRMTQIMLVMTLSGRRVRLYTGLRVKPRFWDKTLYRCMPVGKISRRDREGLEQVNRQINRLERAVDDADERLATRGEYLTESVLRHVMGEVRSLAGSGGQPLPYLRQLAQDYAKEVNRRGRRGNENSRNTYLTALGRLEDYNRTRRTPITSFEDFDRRLFVDFTNYLYKYRFGRNLEKNYTQNTVVNTLKVIKNLLHRAYDNEMTGNDYFKRVQTSLPADVSEPVYLREEEIRKLAAVETRTPSEREVRDMFVIACYTALRFSDLRRLNEAEIDKGVISLYQTKTKEKVTIPILKEIAPLIDHYRREGFPVMDKAKANRIIRLLAERSRLDETVSYREFRGGTATLRTAPKYSLISFHTARRSCVTNLYKRGYPANYIMTLSGHRSMQAFQRYMRASSKEMMSRFFLLLKKDKAIVV